VKQIVPLRTLLPGLLALSPVWLVGCAGYLWPERVERFEDSLTYPDHGALYMAVDRTVRRRTYILGSGEDVTAASQYCYVLRFLLGRPDSTAALSSVEEVYQAHSKDTWAPSLPPQQLAGRVQVEADKLFSPSVPDGSTTTFRGTWRCARRWNGQMWFLVDQNTCYTVTDDAGGTTFVLPPTDVQSPKWNYWDANAGLIVFTESWLKRSPSDQVRYLPPKVYLWYYRENRVETYTIDRVAVDKALRRFIRQHD
jgi:hypothetical protein